MLSRFFKNNFQIRKCSHLKLLTYIAEIYLILISLCFTFAEPFDDIFLFVEVKLWIGQRKYKQKSTTQWRKEWPTEWQTDCAKGQASEFALASLLNSSFAFCKIVVKSIIRVYHIKCTYVELTTQLLIIIGAHCTFRFQLALFPCFSLMHFIALCPNFRCKFWFHSREVLSWWIIWVVHYTL